jgi:hypothetical protein
MVLFLCRDYSRHETVRNPIENGAKKIALIAKAKKSRAKNKGKESDREFISLRFIFLPAIFLR